MDTPCISLQKKVDFLKKIMLPRGDVLKFLRYKKETIKFPAPSREAMA